MLAFGNEWGSMRFYEWHASGDERRNWGWQRWCQALLLHKLCVRSACINQFEVFELLEKRNAFLNGRLRGVLNFTRALQIFLRNIFRCYSIAFWVLENHFEQNLLLERCESNSENAKTKSLVAEKVLLVFAAQLGSHKVDQEILFH